MEVLIDDDTRDILYKLNEKGSAYIVGGYVRDTLLGIKSSDIDIVTNLDKIDIMEALRGYNPVLSNEKYQIITIKLKDKKYEIARLREDIGISDGRNPQYIKFIDDINKDSVRRDFTINAFYYNKELIDTQNGSYDLENRLIRSIGDASIRFSEDRLRILRAFRFMSHLGFELEENTMLVIKNMAKDTSLFSSFSKERLISEFNKILLGRYAYKAIEAMFNLNVLRHFIDIFNKNTFDNILFLEICNKYKKMQESYREIDIDMSYALIFSFSGKKNIHTERLYENDSIEQYEKFRTKFTLNVSKKSIVKNLIYYHNLVNKKPSLIMLKRMLLDLVNNQNVCKLFNLIMILFDLNIKDIQKLLYNIQILYMAQEPVFLSSLDLDNVDLFNLGIEGKKILGIKMDVFSKVLNGDLPNSKFELLSYITKKHLNNAQLKYEKSAGAIVYKKINEKYMFLIIRGSNGGSFGFAKGHMESDECEEQTAIRETKEETNIDIAIRNSKAFRRTLKYVIYPNIYKEVTLFMAEALSADIKIDEHELSKAQWLTYKQAKEALTFLGQRNILKEAMIYLY